MYMEIHIKLMKGFVKNKVEGTVLTISINLIPGIDKKTKKDYKIT